MINLDLVQKKIDIAQQKRLDEAFLGEEPIYPIQKAMDKLYQWNRENPDAKINGCAAERELEDAIKKVFGFKLVDIMWSEAERTGPYTVTPYLWMAYGENKSFAYGKNANGFYDKNHELSVYINMNRSMMSDNEYALTSREAVATLLHEIGHNFDYSPWRVSQAMYFLCLNLFSMNILSIVNNIVQHHIRDITMRVMEIDTVVSDVLPPFRPVQRMANALYKAGNIAIGTIISPVEVLLWATVGIGLSPMFYLQNLFARKSERFADSFAVTYGYSAELITGLDKIIDASTGVNVAHIKDIPVLKQMLSLNRARAELSTIMIGGHESNQKRALKAIDKLVQDAKDPHLSPRMKARLNQEIKELRDVYNKMIGMNQEDRKTLTMHIRRIVDNWYNGRSYFFIPSTGSDYAE